MIKEIFQNGAAREEWIIKNFGLRLRYLRKRLRWSGSYASHQFGISCALLYKLENGATKNPSFKTLLRVSDTFGISLDDLVGRDVPNKKPEKEEKLPSYFLNHDFWADSQPKEKKEEV
ncbi:MAG: hypothetical protein A2309_02865 [Bacteroidetes bacterium RIFOXYB2_FULL_35_7]|nr:MAG: hypothetical protein A2309_02865 [Bacteroidetes bacterium RIFOXYB2_FULL_35_7]